MNAIEQVLGGTRTWGGLFDRSDAEVKQRLTAFVEEVAASAPDRGDDLFFRLLSYYAALTWKLGTAINDREHPFSLLRSTIQSTFVTNLHAVACACHLVEIVSKFAFRQVENLAVTLIDGAATMYGFDREFAEHWEAVWRELTAIYEAKESGAAPPIPLERFLLVLAEQRYQQIAKALDLPADDKAQAAQWSRFCAQVSPAARGVYASELWRASLGRSP